jgi:microcystin-dependent protein
MSSSGKIVNLVNPTIAQDAATKSYVDTSIPVGGIIMWSGTTGTSLPSNWKLCDGSTYNGITTPDLRGRFVLSSTTPTSANGNIALAGGLSTRNVNATGGVETVALLEAQMPSHSHSVSAVTVSNGSHNHTINDSGHRHWTGSGGGVRSSYSYQNGTYDTVGGPEGGYFSDYNNLAYKYTNRNATTGITLDASGGHTHTVTVSETAKGSGQAHENMPPFYVLAFIMRIS